MVGERDRLNRMLREAAEQTKAMQPDPDPLDHDAEPEPEPAKPAPTVPKPDPEPPSLPALATAPAPPVAERSLSPVREPAHRRSPSELAFCTNPGHFLRQDGGSPVDPALTTAVYNFFAWNAPVLDAMRAERLGGTSEDMRR